MNTPHENPNRELETAALDAVRESIESGRNGMQQLHDRLMREPVVSERAEDWIHSPEAGAPLRGYHVGEQFGYSRGHEAGFAKGAAMALLGMLGTLAMGGLTLYLKHRD